MTDDDGNWTIKLADARRVLEDILGFDLTEIGQHMTDADWIDYCEDMAVEYIMSLYGENSTSAWILAIYNGYDKYTWLA